jgi:hypothetical protein
MNKYSDNLNSVKQHYPFFPAWEERGKNGLDQYTKENCLAAQTILDELLTDLAELGENASEEQKIKLFERAVISLNELNDQIDGALIETEEREELCELFNQVAIHAGIDPSKYGEGEGPASEWRDW